MQYKMGLVVYLMHVVISLYMQLLLDLVTLPFLLHLEMLDLKQPSLMIFFPFFIRHGK